MDFFETADDVEQQLADVRRQLDLLHGDVSRPIALSRLKDSSPFHPILLLRALFMIAVVLTLTRSDYLECMDNFLDNPAGRSSFCLDEDRCNIYCTSPPPEGAGTDDCGNPDRNAVPVDCVGDWSDWSECTLPCVGEDGVVGEQTHTYEHNPTNVFGGLPCSIADGVVQTQACNPQVRTIPGARVAPR